MGVLEFEECQHISARRSIEHTIRHWRCWSGVEFNSVLREQIPTNGTYPKGKGLEGGIYITLLHSIESKYPCCTLESTH